MEVILLEDVKSLGKKNQIVKVSDGYAKNFLFPKKLAVEATATNKNSVEMHNKAEAERKEKERAQALQLKDEVEKITVTIKAKGSDTKLFGAITAQEIADALKAQYNIAVDKKKISIASPIKTYGEYTVDVKLYAEIPAKFKVVVVQ